MNNVINYGLIRDELYGQSPTLCIHDGSCKRKVSLVPLGAGGAKRAYSCSDNQRALILPNMDADRLAEISCWWEHVVNCEVRMSRRLEKMGLLSLSMKKITVQVPAFGKDSEIVAYEADSFQQLAERGIYVLDLKNSESSTWNQKFFKSDAERFDLAKWKQIVELLVDDIATLVVHRIGVPSDAINLAVQESGNPDCPCQVRYLGFDFSSKGSINSQAEEDAGRPTLCQKVGRAGKACLGAGMNLVGLESTIDRIATNAIDAIFDREYRAPESNMFFSAAPANTQKVMGYLISHMKRMVYLKIVAKMLGLG